MKLVHLTEEEWFEAIRSLRPIDFLRLWPWSCLHKGESFVAMCKRVEAAMALIEEKKLPGKERRGAHKAAQVVHPWLTPPVRTVIE